MTPRARRLIGCGLALPLFMVCGPIQDRRTQPRTQQTRTAPQRSVSDVPLADFHGILKGLDRKGLTLEVEDGNLLEFQCSRKTRFFVNSKKAGLSAFRPGDRISVETRRALDGVLEAVNVTLEGRKQ
jgi:hypothetical protein